MPVSMHHKSNRTASRSRCFAPRTRAIRVALRLQLDAGRPLRRGRRPTHLEYLVSRHLEAAVAGGRLEGLQLLPQHLQLLHQVALVAGQGRLALRRLAPAALLRRGGRGGGLGRGRRWWRRWWRRRVGRRRLGGTGGQRRRGPAARGANTKRRYENAPVTVSDNMASVIRYIV